MSDEEFMVKIIGEICEYAVMRGMKPDDTLRAVADNISALTEIVTFNNWKKEQ